MKAMPNQEPMIVQGDLSVLLDVHAPRFEEAREALGTFALLEKSPEHLHTYRITPLSLWNAAAAGLGPGDVLLPSRNSPATMCLRTYPTS